MDHPGVARLGEGKPVSDAVRILFTIPNFITAGSGGAMLNIIKRLDRERFAPAVAVLKKGGKLDDEVLRLGIPLIEAQFVIPVKPYATMLARAWKAGEVFRPYNFSIWHSFHYSDDYSEPLVARFSGAKHWVYSKKNMNWNHRSWYLRTLLASKVAAQNTDMLGDFFGSRMFAAKARLIPRGVDLDKFSPMNLSSETFRKALEIPLSAPIVSCVAQLVPVKDHTNLIRAAVLLPGVHFLLAGSTTDENYRDELQTQVEVSGIKERVHFLGSVADVPALLAETDIFIITTKGSGEGCPVALLEAMACGKACVATDVPGSRDIIEDGISGILVEPENAEALANAIRRLIDDRELRASMGKAARARVEEHFSIEQEVAAHEQLYEDVMAKRGTSR